MSEEEEEAGTSPEVKAIHKALRFAQQRREFEAWEIAALKRVAKMVQAFDTFGTIGKMVQRFVIAVGTMLAIWVAMKQGLADWIRGMLK